MQPPRNRLFLVVRMNVIQPSEAYGAIGRSAGVFVKTAADVIPAAVGIAAEDDVGGGSHDGVQLLIPLGQFPVQFVQGDGFLLQLGSALLNPLFEFAVETLKLLILA